MAEDPYIQQSEQAEIDAERAAKAARLFDIRRLIGGLFLIYGVILTVLVLAWAFSRPLSSQLDESESVSSGGGSGGDGDDAVGSRAAGG